MHKEAELNGLGAYELLDIAPWCTVQRSEMTFELLNARGRSYWDSNVHGDMGLR